MKVDANGVESQSLLSSGVIKEELMDLARAAASEEVCTRLGLESQTLGAHTMHFSMICLDFERLMPERCLKNKVRHETCMLGSKLIVMPCICAGGAWRRG